MRCFLFTLVLLFTKIIRNETLKSSIILAFLLAVFFSAQVSAQYAPSKHKALTDGVIPVSKPGSYAKPGATYMLTNDISSSRSTIFLGKDITLDLNGYTITFADTSYEHLPNFSFEQGLESWDISNAPNAKIEDTKVHVFVGEKMLRLSKGEEIISEYINLPVANRSYVAMVGVAKPNMEVSVYVEDEHGQLVVCNTTYRDGIRQSSPMEKRYPRMGGGFVFAHLTGLEAGNYRIRVKAETDCLIDHVDIRPSMDVGIGIVEKTDAMGHNDHLYENEHSAFFDYTENAENSEPIAGIPLIKGEGTVTIKNGTIKNGTLGAISWGIQSTAEDVMVIMDNVRIMNAGINATAADLLQATITNCRFDVDNPFIINRHGSHFYAVDLRGERPSEVSYSEFYGGQGNLVFKGNFSKVHHNYFANRQTVTNHYSVMAMGDTSQVFENIIKPEIGSGIEVYVHRGMEIFNNEIHIEAAPPTSEYGHEDYSTTAIRIADYNAEPGSPTGCFGNKVYNNKIYVTGKDYPEYLDYIPMAWAVFYSASGGDNFIFGNDIQVEEQSPGSKNETSAFYIGGGAIGGEFYDNVITTNVPAAWVASRYGAAKGTKLYENRIIKSPMAEEDFKPFRMGWGQRSVAKDVEFRSNYFEGIDFSINATEQPHEYSVWWTLIVNIVNKEGKSLNGITVQIEDRNGKEIVRQQTTNKGAVEVELPEFYVDEKEKLFRTPYNLIIDGKEQKVDLNKNMVINVVI